jgi:hypothetical protein
MDHKDPLYWAATQLRRHLERLARDGPSSVAQWIEHVGDAHEAFDSARRRIDVARRRGWHLAAAKLHEELFFQARRLEGGVKELLACEDQSPVPSPSISVLLDELKQLREEFADVCIEPRHGRVTARTDRIVLQDIDLGRFAIELHLRRLGDAADSSAFDCVALDPSAPSADEAVTHPHVKDKALCTGDASVPIAVALKQGRIADAFLLVRCVLETYNRQSPYVALEDWAGVSCEDCGGSAARDELHYCEGCHRDVCDECRGSCGLCDSAYCQGCLERDSVSRLSCCPGCRHSCSACGRVVDAESFGDEQQLCPGCLAQRQEQEEEQPPTPTTQEDRQDDREHTHQGQPGGSAGSGEHQPATDYSPNAQAA